LERYPPQGLAFTRIRVGLEKDGPAISSPRQPVEVAHLFTWSSLEDALGRSARERSDVDPVGRRPPFFIGADHSDLAAIGRDGEQAKHDACRHSVNLLFGVVAQIVSLHKPSVDIEEVLALVINVSSIPRKCRIERWIHDCNPRKLYL